MKNECDIVQDLLFGYVDKTLKEGSKEFVDDHLKKCQNCNDILKDLIQNEKNDGKVEIEGLKKVKKSLKTRKVAIILMAIILIIFVFYSVFVFYEYTNNMKKIEIYFKEGVTTEQMNSVKEIIYQIDEDAEIEENNVLSNLEENIDSDMRYLLDGYEDSDFSKYFSVNLKSYKRDQLKEKLDNCEYIKSINTPNYTILDTYGLYFFKLF